jgi:hypothetical protein
VRVDVLLDATTTTVAVEQVSAISVIFTIPLTHQIYHVAADWLAASLFIGSRAALGESTEPMTGSLRPEHL